MNKGKWLKEEGREFLRRMGIREGQIVLDFGCGSGNYAIRAAQIVGEEGIVYALDKSGSALDKLMQKAGSEIYHHSSEPRLIEKQIEGANFHVESEHSETFVHEGMHVRGKVLNFRKEASR